MSTSGTRSADPYLHRVVADIRELLDHIVESGDGARLDPALLRDAAEVLHSAALDDSAISRVKALNVLGRLAAHARPATIAGIRHARRASNPEPWRRAWPLRLKLAAPSILMFGMLAVAASAQVYVAWGSLVVQRIEELRPQVERNREQLATAEIGVRALQPPDRPVHVNSATQTDTIECVPKAISAAPADARTALQRYCTLADQQRGLERQFDVAFDRLQDWSNFLWRPVMFWRRELRPDAICFAEAAYLRLTAMPDAPRGVPPPFDAARLVWSGAADVARPTPRPSIWPDIVPVASQGSMSLGRTPLLLGSRCAPVTATMQSADDLNELGYRIREQRQQEARMFMAAFAVTVLPAIFGLLGAVIAQQRALHRATADQTVDARFMRRRRQLILLGGGLGWLSGVLFTPAFVIEHFGLQLVVVALLFGYSVELAFQILDNLVAVVVRGTTSGRPAAATSRTSGSARPRAGAEARPPSPQPGRQDDAPPIAPTPQPAGSLA